MSDESAQRSWPGFGVVALCCPLALLALVLASRAQLLRFHDDFSGMKGVGFIMLAGLALLGIGTGCGLIALRQAPRSWLARAATALNASLLAGMLLAIAGLAS